MICACSFVQDVGRLDEIRKARDKARAAFEESEKTRQAAAMGGVVGTDFTSEMVTTYPINAIEYYLEYWILTLLYHLLIFDVTLDNGHE